jgi:Ca-activated chloride channel family protein
MANIGQTDPNALAREASSLVTQGISVSGVGLGLDYSEDTLAAISDAGGGTYRFVDRPGQLSEVFASELRQMSELVAREATISLSTPPSTQIIEVFGYSSHRTDSGIQVFLGDVHAGQTRKVVARVAIDSGAGDAIKVSDASLSYITPASSSTAAASFTALSSLSALLSRDPILVASSTNLSASRQGVQAHASWYMDEGARAWERGDRRSNRDMMAQGQALLRETAEANKDETLATQAAKVQRRAEAFDAAGFDSDDGLYQVKKAKEEARAYSH